MAFLIVVAVIVIILLYSWMNIKPKNFPPGPPCFPLVGSVPFLPRKYSHLIMAGNWMEKYGPVVGLLLGPRKAVAVSGARAVFQVLRREEFQGRTESSKLKEASFNKRLGVIFTDGPYWHELRRFIVRNLRDFGFGKTSMEGMIMQEIDILMTEMRSKDIVQACDLFKIPTLNIVWRMISGKRFARRDEELQTLLQGVGSVFRFGSQSGRLSDVFPILRRIFPRSTGATAFMDTIKNLQSFMKVRDLRTVMVVTLVIVVVIVIVVVVSAVVVVIVIVVLVSAVVVVIVVSTVVVVIAVVLVSAVVVVVIDSTSGISSCVGGNRSCDHRSACDVSSAVIVNYEILFLIRKFKSTENSSM